MNFYRYADIFLILEDVCAALWGSVWAFGHSSGGGNRITRYGNGGMGVCSEIGSLV